MRCCVWFLPMGLCVCVTVKVKRERGSEGGGGGGCVAGTGWIFKRKGGCAHVWCTASDEQNMTSMPKTVRPLWFEINMKHFMWETSICVRTCSPEWSQEMIVKDSAYGSTWGSLCTTYPWQGLLLVQCILGFEGRLACTISQEGTSWRSVIRSAQ